MKKFYLFGGVVLVFAAAGTVAFLYLSQPPPSAAVAPRRAPARSAEAVAALREQAAQGNVGAQVELGRLYAKGEGITNSYREAAKWYEKAANQGNAEAELALGELCEAGQGVLKDVPRAIKLYRQAAEQGNAGAQYTLGFMYESGSGLPTDQAQAAQWFRRAAEGGDPLAQYDLGQRYDLGVGVPVDRIESYKWLSLASAQGQADSPSRLKTVQAKMTRAEIKEAKRRVADFAPSKKPQAGHDSYPTTATSLSQERFLWKEEPVLVSVLSSGDVVQESYKSVFGNCGSRPKEAPIDPEKQTNWSLLTSAPTKNKIFQTRSEAKGGFYLLGGLLPQRVFRSL